MHDSPHPYTVPAPASSRKKLRLLLRDYVEENALLPPLSLDELNEHVRVIKLENGLETTTHAWLMVELNNAVWRETVAGIPMERRMLLLPKCLSNTTVCTATFDELGLLCQRCRHCSIHPLQDEADRLGIMSVVAEGFTSIIPLLQNNVVDTIVGVGCLDSLERAFPLLVKQAVPALAVPLNRIGCADTDVDEDYVRELLGEQSVHPVQLLDFDQIKQQLNDWFSVEVLKTVLSPSLSRTSTLALECLAGDGKRWRPYLLVATCQALSGKAFVDADIQKAALAVECFHKASLVHDDIQDADTERNGKPTIHEKEGISTAINVGDLLLGEGYRLLATIGEPELIAIASKAHLDLCKGQGLELEWSLSPAVLTMDEVLTIFSLKTVPAFEVSLKMALVCAHSDNPQLESNFHRFAHSLGLAYQLFDDISDFDTDNYLLLRPSAVVAAMLELQSDPQFVQQLLSTNDVKRFIAETNSADLLQKALDRVGLLASYYRNQVFEALKTINHVELKRLLFRVSHRILSN